MDLGNADNSRGDWAVRTHINVQYYCSAVRVQIWSTEIAVSVSIHRQL